MTHEVRYPLAEKFLAPQGEGLYTGTQMAFVRMVGCSVGKKVCTACDTDFDTMRTDLGGGAFTPKELAEWVGPVRHVCVTGGEPLDRDLRALVTALPGGTMVHVETSGTTHPNWLDGDGKVRDRVSRGVHYIAVDRPEQRLWLRWEQLWITVSPKPGWRADMLALADEVKVIIGGLGDGDGWPTVDDARQWAADGKLVYVQPRNGLLEIDQRNMKEALAVVAKHPELRLSTQLHKYIRTR